MVKTVKTELVDIRKLELAITAVDLLMGDILGIKEGFNRVLHARSSPKNAATLLSNEKDIAKLKKFLLSSELHSKNMQKFSKEALASLEASLTEL